MREVDQKAFLAHGRISRGGGYLVTGTLGNYQLVGTVDMYWVWVYSGFMHIYGTAHHTRVVINNFRKYAV
jgi:hypothetical protein